VQADGHDGSRTCGETDVVLNCSVPESLVPRRGLEPPRLAALVPET